MYLLYQIVRLILHKYVHSPGTESHFRQPLVSRINIDDVLMKMRTVRSTTGNR